MARPKPPSGSERTRYLRAACLLGMGAAIGVGCSDVRAESASVAVATNFLVPMETLRADFEAATDHELTVVGGSTGQLYAQIVNGAPFDVFLAADEERPRLLAGNGRGISSSRFAYAVGRLVLWSRRGTLLEDLTLEELDNLPFRWLAIASPELAPYGAAARQALRRLGLWEALQTRLVRGENIAQTFALIDTGNAELGFVSLSQALAYGPDAAFTLVPEHLYAPIRQGAIQLDRAAENRAALDFLAFLKSAAGAAIVERHGYRVPVPSIAPAPSARASRTP